MLRKIRHTNDIFRYINRYIEDGAPIKIIEMRIKRILDSKDFIKDVKEMDIEDFELIISKLKDRGINTNIIEELKSIRIYSKPIDDEKKIDLFATGNNKKILFFFGAGASAPSGIPTVSGMGTEFLNKIEQTGNKNLNDIKKMCNGSNTTDIDLILTAIQLAEIATQDFKLINLLENILNSGKFSEEASYREQSFIYSLKDTSQVIFSVLAGMMIEAEPNDIHKKLTEYINNKKLMEYNDKVVFNNANNGNISIITTNYDILIENALLDKKIHFNYMIDEKEDSTEEKINLLKMHGSLNWYYCESCHDTTIIDVRKLADNYKEGIYPIVGLCKECKSTNKLLIVPPTKFKSIYLPLVKIWAKVEKEFDEADVIVFVGYSFDSSDDYITNMITKSIMKNKDKTIILFNKSSETIINFKKHLNIRLVDENKNNNDEDSSFVKNNFFYYIGNAEVEFVKFVNSIFENME